MSSSKSIKYSGNVGKKFNEDGSAKAFPGNTIVYHVPPDSQTFQFLISFRKLLQQQPWAKNYSFLPPSSFHMTVMEGVLDDKRKPAYWTSKLPLDAPLDAVDQLLIEEWKKIKKPTGFTMQMDQHNIFGTIGISLKPISSEMERKIRDFRDIMSKAFGIRFPGHDYYKFHISFAYQIIKLNFYERIQSFIFMKRNLKMYREQFGTVVLNEPELAFFIDMTDFAPSRVSAKTESE